MHILTIVHDGIDHESSSNQRISEVTLANRRAGHAVAHD
jgi:hypothetical protein